MDVVHPKVVADRVTGFVDEIQRGLSSIGRLDRPSGQVSPQGCDNVQGVTRVQPPDDAGERNPYEDPWYVDYSPFTILYIGHLDVASVEDFRPVFTQLRDHLLGAGWQAPREFLLEPRPGDDYARLVIEAPEPGYGVRVVGIMTTTGQPRIVVYVSSPCVRHTDEI